MRTSTILLISCSLTLPLILQAQSYTPLGLTDFTNCINGTLSNLSDYQTVSGDVTSTYCPLSTAGSPYSVTSPIVITLSNLTITGAGAAPSDTVLQRDSSSVRYIMQLQECDSPGCTPNSPTNITIENHTYDGNRATVQSELGNSTFCPEEEASYVDLMLDSGSYHGNSPVSIVTVEDCDFNNAPEIGLWLDGTASGDNASTVSHSNWATGGESTGGRATGIFLNGEDSGAYYNCIKYQGTAAINVSTGTTNYVYGNTIEYNRIEDCCGGGQIYTNSQSSYAKVASNWVDGGNIQLSGSEYRGCYPGTNVSATGIEIYASSSPSFYNNQLQNHYGIAVEVNTDYYPSNLTFSATNPWNGSDPYKCITYTGWRGFYFQGTMSNYVGVSFSDVCVTYTGQNGYTGVGIELSNVNGTGFINGACMHNNTGTDVQNDSYVDLTNPPPGTPNTCSNGQ